MNNLKNEVLQEFQRISASCNARLTVADTFCEFSKNGITLRARWSIERTSGMFVTLTTGTKEYGLPYLVEFRGGTATELADASSDNPTSTIEVVKKYALPFLEATAHDYPSFVEFAERRISENTSASGRT